tara:strand:+ start:179 stop:442 length:264 start_codon:yes stop_codon:yes gene_type:complete
MKNLNTSILLGKKVYVSGWQYDNSGVLLNGVITETLNAEDNYGRLAYILKTSDAEYKLNWIVVKGLIENGVYEADRMLNSGTSAVIL